MNKYYLSKQPVAGFTLIELLTTVLLISIVSAIAIPSFTALINRQRLNNAQEQVFIVMRNAQASAKRERTTWTACFRDDGTRVLTSISRLPQTAWTCASATNWQPLLGEDSKRIAINTANTSINASPATYYPVQFKYDGSITQRRRITLNIRNENNGIKRCVFIATLLGALRSDRDAACLTDDP
jgi:prepilin-type N-terminal cleavage/methylation domain-containing protein